MEDFTRDFVSEHIHVLSAAQRLEGLSIEEILQKLPPEKNDCILIM
jgi:hypothetical protein